MIASPSIYQRQMKGISHPGNPPPLTGVMYATGGVGDPIPNVAHQSTGLLTIDKSTGAATLVGYAGGNCCAGDFGIMLNGLGFSSDGTLFATGWALGGPSYPDPSTSHLYTVDLTTGVATRSGPTALRWDARSSTAGSHFARTGLC